MKTLFASSRRTGKLVAVSIGLALAIGPAEAAVLKEARVTQVIQDVKLLPSQAAPKPAVPGDDVRGDTAVRTGVDSRAELTFTDLTIARLGANTIFSFNEGTRTIALSNGAILLRVPKGSGGAKIQTAAVTAAITGTTVMVEYHPDSYAKYIVLEGTMRLYMKGRLGESILMGPGQMMIVRANATQLSEVVDVDLDRLIKTSLFFTGFRPLGSENLMADEQRLQLEKKAAGELLDTNLVIFGRGTLVALTDPNHSDTLDLAANARRTPTPTPTPQPTVTPTPTPQPTVTPTPTPQPTVTPTPTPQPTVTPTPTPQPSVTPTPTPQPTVTPTPTPQPTATPTPTPQPTATSTPTPRPTPQKFGTPPVITSKVPYTIDTTTTIQTDPVITTGALVDEGRIYRDTAQDGPFSAWAFTSTSAFDAQIGIDDLYGPNAPVAAFKFAELELAGNPTISTANGGALNLALISVGPISSAPLGNAAFTFTGMNSVLLATQNGSIDTTAPDISFRNIPLLVFYARGPGSNLTLGGMGIFDVGTLRVMAENNIQLNAPQSLSSGANGGTLFGTAGGTFTVNSRIDTPTPIVGPGVVSGAGGTVALTSLTGGLTVNSTIQVSFADASDRDGRRSASGGIITLHSGLTTGTGITLGAGANLLSLLDPSAPGPAGAITLDTDGSDIVFQGGSLRADRGTITIQQIEGPPAGTAQITLDGGSIQSETAIFSSAGDLNIGNTTPVTLSAVTLSLLANNNLNLDSLFTTEGAARSNGNVTLRAGNDITIGNGLTIDRFNLGITDGINILVDAGRTLQIDAGLALSTNGSGLTNGANITVNSGVSLSITGLVQLDAGTFDADQGTGSNIKVEAKGTATFANFSANVRMGPGRTLTNGGNINFSATGAVLATAGEGSIDLEIDNMAPGMIGTGGNITLTLSGPVTTGGGGHLGLFVLNNGGTIQNGGIINASIGGNLNTLAVEALIDNRGGTIGNGAAITFGVAGTLSTSGGASFTILNSQLGGPGGTIGSNAFINLTLANTNIGGDLNAYINNLEGKIGGAGGTVTLQLNGTLAVTGRLNVFGTVNSTSTVNAGTLSTTNLITPAAVTVGGGGITRFSFPNDVTINPLHILTVGSLSSAGGINFNGPDLGTPPGFGPFSGGQLTINVPSLSFGPSAADNIRGPVTFNGGASNTAAAGGSGGTFTVNTTGALTVNSPIEATTGLQPYNNAPGGDGGTVNLNSTSGTVAIRSRVQVSSAEVSTTPSPPPRRRSRSGGNINLTSGATGTAPAPAVAINIANTGQLVSLLDAAAPGPGGRITIRATGADSNINVNGAAVGGPPTDTIRADRGTVDVRHTGDRGRINLNGANIRADVVKVGALGSNGVLSIGGGTITADTILRLYANGTNGQIQFIANVTLDGNSVKTIAANTVTVFQNVVVTIGGGKVADIYTNTANYSVSEGGNGSTNGRFIILGGGGSPSPGATTHLGVAPPDFDGP